MLRLFPVRSGTLALCVHRQSPYTCSDRLDHVGLVIEYDDDAVIDDEEFHRKYKPGEWARYVKGAVESRVDG